MNSFRWTHPNSVERQVRYAVYTYLLVIFLIFVAGSAWTLIGQATIVAAALMATRNKTLRSFDPRDGRHFGYMFLNAFFAVFVFAFLSHPLRWVILAIGLYCAALAVLLGRLQHDAQ